jgi:hypothetical protein
VGYRGTEIMLGDFDDRLANYHRLYRSSSRPCWFLSLL